MPAVQSCLHPFGAGRDAVRSDLGAFPSDLGVTPSDRDAFASHRDAFPSERDAFPSERDAFPSDRDAFPSEGDAVGSELDAVRWMRNAGSRDAIAVSCEMTLGRTETIPRRTEQSLG